ncbi:MAG: DUF2752 domain-containing protein [Mediterranea sp.]|jgi:hypothetical protein|nr:DUF2752 domain-containing protein [Mediterranea sp.]
MGAGIVLGIVLLVWLYKTYNPMGYSLFPKCLFKLLTGYDCPGCGSQRAIHYLLNGEIGKAMGANMLVVVSIPYLLLAVLLDYVLEKTPRRLRIRNLLYGKYAIWTIFTLVILFWIGKNVIGKT